ncbi:sulfatase-like hydrolase/transferase [Aliamphritea ceti]|uniref:sulfatase-like hydrolase/transferase n=1 Tax=Aliamphritea ceti TaxID=1524258 RepID=UPI0021C437CA|nr:sulfatase-like hydrolase/transferase [Aliamphritea ceti]
MIEPTSLITITRIFWRTVFLILFVTCLLLFYRKLLQYYPPAVIADLMTHVKNQHFINFVLVFDLFYFFVVCVILHLIWAAVITVSCKPWIEKKWNDNTKTLIWMAIFFGHMTLIIALNSLFYPTSLLGFLRHSYIVSPALLIFLSFILGSLFLYGMYHLIGGVKLSIVATITIIFTSVNLVSFKNNVQSPQQKPNVIIIGVDGLRPDHLLYKNGPLAWAPNINGFLSEAVVYDHTYSPMARTYVAWMSLLSGTYPVKHGARFNLTSPSQVNTEFDLINKLKKNNYKMHYAMDERRFNQIDEAYGFDKVIGPKAGAADALIANNADLPLINLMLNNSFSKYIFPYLYMNRAYGKAYRPHQFNKEVVNSLATDSPNFLAAHFCMLHWPYTSREFIPSENTDWTGNYNHFMYKKMLQKMDNQFADFIHRLKESGQLNNAHVYVFSDHGEGFMLEKDTISNPSYPDDYSLKTNAWGHGTNVMNQAQADVLLAYSKFENGRSVQQGSVISGLFSLVDIAPSILAKLELSDHLSFFDGEPLPSREKKDNNRMIFVESSLPVKSLNTSFIDKKAVFSETYSKYLVDGNGRLIIKPNEYSSFIKRKQRSIYYYTWQLIFLPDHEELVLIDTLNSKWHYLSEYKGDAPWPVMLKSICEHYSEDPGFDPYGYCQSNNI